MAFSSAGPHNPVWTRNAILVSMRQSMSAATTGGVMTADKTGRLADLYWQVLSPVVHRRAARLVLLALLTALFVFAPTFLRKALLTFHVIP
jgi:hypothetical protein